MEMETIELYVESTIGSTSWSNRFCNSLEDIDYKNDVTPSWAGFQLRTIEPVASSAYDKS